MPTFVTHLESAIDGTHLPAGTLQTTHKDRPLWVRYDLPAIKRAVTRDEVMRREPTMWRWRELLPVERPGDIISLGEDARYGARTFLVNGLITDCAKIIREGAQRMGWFDFSTLKEPYRIEGKKTMGLELAAQSAWLLPDVILYPTGGGTGLIGMWKAFAELEALGWLDASKKPRMFSCQSNGCAPIATAFDKGERFAEPAPNPHTIASGLRVPRALGDFMILDAVRESGGRAMAAEESRIIEWMHLATSTEGIALCPESAACIGVLQRALAEGHIRADEKIVLFNTGAMQKYVEVMRVESPSVDHASVEWRLIER